MLRQVARSLNWYFQRQHLHNTAALPMEKNVREIKIPVPWGHIAGKWWGPEDVKPVLCLHGYMDNAASWDNLAPLLPPDLSLLAFDMPGHGHSSHFPRGTAYHRLDFVLAIQRIVNYYGWEKISLLGHSFGSVMSFIYASTFPENVDKYVAIDAIKPMNINPGKQLDKLTSKLDLFLEIDSLDPNKAPSYTYEEAVEHLHKSIKHMASKEACRVLTSRGMIKLSDDRFIFSRDPRLKVSVDLDFPKSGVLAFAKEIRCQVLNIKAKEGLNFGTPEEMEEFIDIIKSNADYYEYHNIEGNHHIHMDYPERIAPIITEFLSRK
ncbi:putative serine hydrolase [Blattella germanica]|nr:putative serine hydrolase [Blattella germanica]